MNSTKTAVKNCVNKLKVLADETRMMVIREIKHEGKTVSEINKKIKIDQSLLSHHLKILRDAGLVEVTRQGKFNLYKVSSDILTSSTEQLIDLGCCSLNFKEKSL